MKTTIPIGAIGNYGGGPLGRPTSFGNYYGHYGGYGAPASIPGMNIWGATVLKEGMNDNSVVKRVQEILNFLGYKDHEGKVLGEDGDFGERTEDAVYTFNRDAVSKYGIPTEYALEGIEPATVKASLIQSDKTVTKTTAEMLNHALKQQGGGSTIDNAVGALSNILDPLKPWGSKSETTTTNGTTNGGTATVAAPLIPGWVKWAGLGVGGLIVVLLIANLAKKKDK